MCWATNYLAAQFDQISDWKTARVLLEEIPEQERDGGSWHALGTIDLNEGNYAKAREHFGKSLAIEQQIGNKAGEAGTWHYLGTIDLNEGNYAKAREHFGKALEMRIQIGDKAGEAGTWHNLGFIAWESGRQSAGVRLVALSWFIFHSIGAGDAKQALNNLAGMCAELKYSEEELSNLLAEVVQSYQSDRGQKLLQEAFPK
jgi:tetratricopeptide (TPR) repeat protein